MISEETFNMLSDFLLDKISPTIPPGYGEDDISPKKKTEAQLCKLFENYVYAAGMGYFLMGKNGVLYVYNGRYYEQVTTKTFLQVVIKHTLQKLGVGIVYQEFSHKKIADECLAGMENKKEGQFVPDRHYIAFNNGIFDVKRGCLVDFDMRYRTDLVLDIDYVPTATHALWETKLVEIIPNKSMRDAFQMFCGTFLIDRSKLKVEYICYLIGPGSNGKSVIAAAIASTFGNQYFGKFEPKQLLKTSDAMFNMASLDGKIGNFTDDLGKEDLSGGQFKRFVSGEEIPARHPFGRCVFNVAAPLMICCVNEMPATTDDSWGHHRRQLPIYSSSKVWGEKDKDPYLGSKLSVPEARMAIFNWIYEGYKKIIENGGNIDLGQEVIDAQIALRDDSNSARRWIRDMNYIKVDNPIDRDVRWKYLSEWHSIYKRYCEDNGDHSPQIAKSLTKLFREKGFLEKRGKLGIMFCIGQKNVDTLDTGVIDEDELPF